MLYGNLLFFLIVAVVIYLMLRKGGGCCGGHDHSGHQQGGHGNSLENKEAGHTHYHMQGDAAGEISETDPVCGMKVSGDAIESSYLGKTFHFCSEQCKRLFNLNPNKYADASRSS